MKERHTDILIVGGGTGAIGAALAALRMGKSVIMSEETDWIGGQLTAQAVPPDENPWVDQCGATATYMRFSDGVRDYYRRNYPLTDKARYTMNWNPGQGNVSRLCHEPRIGLAVIEEMLAPYRSSMQLDILLNHIPVAAETDGDRVLAATLEDTRNGDRVVISAPYILDATELGDLLELADVESIIGAESQAQTGEMHAVEGEAQPLDQQAISWCFAIDHLEGEDHTIDKPEDYDFWREYQADFLARQAIELALSQPRHLGNRAPQYISRRFPSSIHRRPRRPLALPANLVQGALSRRDIPKRHHAGQLAANRLLVEAPARRFGRDEARGSARMQAVELLPAVLDADGSAAA